MYPVTKILVLATAATVSAAVIDIDVGEDGITFDPKSTTAKVGDTLAFHFYEGTGPHSVVRASFDSPCVPVQDAFFSGYFDGSDGGDAQVFEVAVTSEDPIWFYCSAKKHCQNGMVGVVNPPAGKSIDDFANAARAVAAASAPAAPIGGTSTSLASGGSDDSSTSNSAAPTTMASSDASAGVTSAVSSAASAGSSAATAGGSSASSVASSSSAQASSLASAASTAATSTSTPAGAMKKDGKAAAALAVVAGGLVALLA